MYPAPVRELLAWYPFLELAASCLPITNKQTNNFRIGRTGRKGNSGTAYTLFTRTNAAKVNKTFLFETFWQKLVKLSGINCCDIFPPGSGPGVCSHRSQTGIFAFYHLRIFLWFSNCFNCFNCFSCFNCFNQIFRSSTQSWQNWLDGVVEEAEGDMGVFLIINLIQFNLI